MSAPITYTESMFKEDFNSQYELEGMITVRKSSFAVHTGTRLTLDNKIVSVSFNLLFPKTFFSN